MIHVALFWWIIGFSQSVTTCQRVTLTLLVSVLLFSLLQYENFLWGFQIQFVGVFAAATAAFGSIAKSADIRSRQVSHGELKALLWLGLGLACFIVSILMMSNGLLAGMPLIILAFWLRVPRLHLAIIAAVFVMSAGVYLNGYHSPEGHANPLESLAQIDGVLLYTAAYLGAPFGPISADVSSYFQFSQAGVGVFAAQAMGLLGLVISAVLGILVVKRGRDQACRAEGALLMVVAMVVGTALVHDTGAGVLVRCRCSCLRDLSPPSFCDGTRSVRSWRYPVGGLVCIVSCVPDLLGSGSGGNAPEPRSSGNRHDTRSEGR
jgi:hypothetical protein